MIRFKFEDKKISLPTEWGEVTVEMFINPLFYSGDSLSLLSALSGVPKMMLANTTIDLMPHLEKVSKFIKDNPVGWKLDTLPESVELLGVSCKVPKDIHLERFGQKILLGQALVKAGNARGCLPEAVAIYLAPQVFPEDWTEKIEEVKAEILKKPIREIYNIADFFLSPTST